MLVFGSAVGVAMAKDRNDEHTIDIFTGQTEADKKAKKQ
jgi:hypothetical protein